MKEDNQIKMQEERIQRASSKQGRVMFILGGSQYFTHPNELENIRMIKAEQGTRLGQKIDNVLPMRCPCQQ